MKKTSKKVEVRNGTRTYIRTVFVSEFGGEHFKDEGAWHLIFMRSNGKGYNAPYYNGIRYI